MKLKNLKRYTITGDCSGPQPADGVPRLAASAYQSMLAAEWIESSDAATMPAHEYDRSRDAVKGDAYKATYGYDGVARTEKSCCGAVAYVAGLVNSGNAAATLGDLVLSVTGDRYLADGCIVYAGLVADGKPPALATVATWAHTGHVCIPDAADGDGHAIAPNNRAPVTDTATVDCSGLAVSAGATAYLVIVLMCADYTSVRGAWIEGGAMLDAENATLAAPDGVVQAEAAAPRTLLFFDPPTKFCNAIFGNYDSPVAQTNTGNLLIYGSGLTLPTTLVWPAAWIRNMPSEKKQFWARAAAIPLMALSDSMRPAEYKNPQQTANYGPAAFGVLTADITKEGKKFRQTAFLDNNAGGYFMMPGVYRGTGANYDWTQVRSVVVGYQVNCGRPRRFRGFSLGFAAAQGGLTIRLDGYWSPSPMPRFESYAAEYDSVWEQAFDFKMPGLLGNEEGNMAWRSLHRGLASEIGIFRNRSGDPLPPVSTIPLSHVGTWYVGYGADGTDAQLDFATPVDSDGQGYFILAAYVCDYTGGGTAVPDLPAADTLKYAPLPVSWTYLY